MTCTTYICTYISTNVNDKRKHLSIETLSNEQHSECFILLSLKEKSYRALKLKISCAVNKVISERVIHKESSEFFISFKKRK